MENVSLSVPWFLPPTSSPPSTNESKLYPYVVVYALSLSQQTTAQWQLVLGWGIEFQLWQYTDALVWFKLAQY